MTRAYPDCATTVNEAPRFNVVALTLARVRMQTRCSPGAAWTKLRAVARVAFEPGGLDEFIGILASAMGHADRLA